MTREEKSFNAIFSEAFDLNMEPKDYIELLKKTGWELYVDKAGMFRDLKDENDGT